jgi:hypothetical protein
LARLLRSPGDVLAVTGGERHAIIVCFQWRLITAVISIIPRAIVVCFQCVAVYMSTALRTDIEGAGQGCVYAAMAF